MRLLASLFFIFLFLACKDSAKIPDDFDYGKVENGVYKNSFFGFELPVPSDWAVESREQMKQIGEEGAKIIAEHNKDLGKKIKASQISSAMLLSVFKYKDDSIVRQYNPSFGMAVENIGNSFAIKNGEDYLRQVKKLMQNSGIQYKFLADFNSLELGGKNFSAMELTAVYKADVEVGQIYYATVEKGFAISIVASFVTDDQREELRQILSKIHFK